MLTPGKVVTVRETRSRERIVGHPAMTSTERANDTTRAAEHRPAVQDFLAGDQGAQTYGASITDALLRRWRQRGVIALVTGAVFTFLFDFRIGISAAVMAAILDMVWRARSARTEANAGGPKLDAAMRRTERQLRGFDRKGYRVLHARSIPGTPNRIDHLIIGPTGIYVVDSEKWPKYPIRTMSHRKLFLGANDMGERMDEARFEARQATRLISAELGSKVKVQPSLAIYGPSIPWKVLNVRDVDVYSGGHARAYLRRKKKLLSADEIDRISRAAEKALPPMPS